MILCVQCSLHYGKYGGFFLSLVCRVVCMPSCCEHLQDRSFPQSLLPSPSVRTGGFAWRGTTTDSPRRRGRGNGNHPRETNLRQMTFRTNKCKQQCSGHRPQPWPLCQGSGCRDAQDVVKLIRYFFGCSTQGYSLHPGNIWCVRSVCVIWQLCFSAGFWLSPRKKNNASKPTTTFCRGLERIRLDEHAAGWPASLHRLDLDSQWPHPPPDPTPPPPS